MNFDEEKELYEQFVANLNVLKTRRAELDSQIAQAELERHRRLGRLEVLREQDETSETPKE